MGWAQQLGIAFRRIVDVAFTPTTSENLVRVFVARIALLQMIVAAVTLAILVMYSI